MWESDHGRAYDQLRSMFTQDFRPLPVHYHSSVYGLGDLAAAAVRAGRADEARAVLDSSLEILGAEQSPRVRAVLRRATALLGDPDGAEEHFLAAVADPAAARWPSNSPSPAWTSVNGCAAGAVPRTPART
ncbi:hypothetical protein [Streptomyces sp. NRRL F-5123]|uniref:hypothetical protein n=1 Tax=Streptomyces sp. NRRL F-5123 TaxID=1463856 RepID=UPI0004E24563|nr:hypothetical protein [Streptomyces sp. NRRL F-5123]